MVGGGGAVVVVGLEVGVSSSSSFSGFSGAGGAPWKAYWPSNESHSTGLLGNGQST